MMESAEGIIVHEDPMKRFHVGYEHLKSRVEYVFKCTRMKQDTWGVPYWSLKSPKKFDYEIWEGWRQVKASGGHESE